MHVHRHWCLLYAPPIVWLRFCEKSRKSILTLSKCFLLFIKCFIFTIREKKFLVLIFTIIILSLMMIINLHLLRQFQALQVNQYNQVAPRINIFKISNECNLVSDYFVYQNYHWKISKKPKQKPYTDFCTIKYSRYKQKIK